MGASLFKVCPMTILPTRSPQFEISASVHSAWPYHPLFPTFQSSASLSLAPKTFPSAAQPCFPSETHFRRRTLFLRPVTGRHTGDCPPRPLARVTNFKIAHTLRRVVAEPASLGLVGQSEGSSSELPKRENISDGRRSLHGPFDEAAMALAGV